MPSSITPLPHAGLDRRAVAPPGLPRAHADPSARARAGLGDVCDEGLDLATSARARVGLGRSGQSLTRAASRAGTSRAWWYA